MDSFVNCDKSVHWQVRANETYSEVKHSLVIEPGMFLCMSSPLISGGPV